MRMKLKTQVLFFDLAYPILGALEGIPKDGGNDMLFETDKSSEV